MLSFMPRLLYPPGRSHPSTPWIGWVSPKAGLYVVEKIKILFLPGSAPRRSSPQPVTIPTKLSDFQKCSYWGKNNRKILLGTKLYEQKAIYLNCFPFPILNPVFTYYRKL
jgi:hypothetical protein